MGIYYSTYSIDIAYIVYIYIYTIYIYMYTIYIYIYPGQDPNKNTSCTSLLLFICNHISRDHCRFHPFYWFSSAVETEHSYGIPLSALNTAPEVLHTGLGENDLLGSMIAKHLGATASQTHSDGFVLHASINIMKKQYYESCMNFLF